MLPHPLVFDAVHQTHALSKTSATPFTGPFDPATTLDRASEPNAGDDPGPEPAPVPQEPIAKLLPVLTRQVGTEKVNAINARDLHRFFGVGKDFSSWFKDRVQEFDFAGNKGFEVFPETGGKPTGRPAKEYALTLDIAKEPAMVERTPRGKQARLSFIEVEKRWRFASATNTETQPMIDVYGGLVLAWHQMDARVQESDR